MNIFELKNIAKYYGSSAEEDTVLKDVNLSVEEGEFVAILGFSGAGKTTLISLLSGLTAPDEGTIIFNNKELTAPRNDIGVVFQNYSLMPWLSVEGNVALSVNSLFKGKNKEEKKELIDRYIDMVGLSHASERKPAELSGGMRQRVAVARALAMQPKVLLLDEPLSALDALTRSKLQDEFAEISQKEKRTIIMITNDVDEAILLADRVITLTPGPAATLGKEFQVNLPRPRDRASTNSNQDFINLRKNITNHLITLGAERSAEQTSSVELPNITPMTVGRENPPAAYLNEAQSKNTDRFLEFSQLSKVYPTPKGPLKVVDEFEIKIKKGEFITLIGHSGCGKSTVLSMAAGLNEITSGGIVLDNRHISTAGPDRAVVFQAPSLMPWLTAFENVSLGVERVYPKASLQERKDIVEYYLARVGLGDSMHKLAHDLSNGMRQRVGIARAFSLSPKLLLLDEPFGMLDSLTRWELQEVLMDVWERTKVTTICVTHDVDEAILLADRVVMMSNGPNAKIGNVMEVDLPKPRSRAALISHPDYYAYREELIDFLEAYEGGANPSEDALEAIRKKRELRINLGAKKTA